MRYYEIVFLVHPDNSEPVSSLIDKYTRILKSEGGEINRLEDWGLRPLAYPIQHLHKAHYVLINAEASESSIEALETEFRFNDTILRNLVMRTKGPVTEASPMCKGVRSEKRAKVFEKEYLNLVISKGSAGASDIAEFMHELSVLYQMVGGSGLKFKTSESSQVVSREYVAHAWE